MWLVAPLPVLPDFWSPGPVLPVHVAGQVLPADLLRITSTTDWLKLAKLLVQFPYGHPDPVLKTVERDEILPKVSKTS